MAAIKIHGAVDVEIRGNLIYRSILGLWLDWMAQGTRVTGNLFHDNDVDLFVEVDHGPFLVDNNLFLSRKSLRDLSQGGAYVHNLFAGVILLKPYDARQTPFLKPHSTEVAGLHDNPPGDDRFYNNLFVENPNLSFYDEASLPVWMEGNVFLKGARPSREEKNPLLEPNFDPAIKLVEKPGGSYLEINFDKAWAVERTRSLVSTKLLGMAAIPKASYENPDGSPLRIDADYFGKQRDPTYPTPGPFESPGSGALTLKVW